MAANAPLINEVEIKYDLYQAFISGKIRYYYMVYNELTDELILRFVSPEVIASVYDRGNNFAFLIDPDTDQVVGYHFYRFQSYHLQEGRFKGLNKFWYRTNLAKHFSEYKQLAYNPREHRPPEPVKTQRVYQRVNDVLESAFA